MKEYVVILLIVSVVFGVPDIPFNISSDYILVFDRLNDGANRTGDIIPLNLNQTGKYIFIVAGAQGGNASNYTGGPGSIVKGEFSFQSNDNLQMTIVVGKSGESRAFGMPGGGGGSFIYIKPDKLLIAAGGGGGSSVLSNGNPATTTNVGGDAKQSANTGICITDENCTGKGGQTSQYGGYPIGPCSSTDTKTDCTCAGGIGMGWSGLSSQVPGFINLGKSGKPGKNYSDISEPFFGGTGGIYIDNGGSGGYGGGGGGGGFQGGDGGQPSGGPEGSCGSGAGGGYSGGGVGVGRYSAGGGGSSFCGGTNCLALIQNSTSYNGGLAVIYRLNSPISTSSGSVSNSPISTSSGSVSTKYFEVHFLWICLSILKILN